MGGDVEVVADIRKGDPARALGVGVTQCCRQRLGRVTGDLGIGGSAGEKYRRVGHKPLGDLCRLDEVVAFDKSTVGSLQ